MSVFHAAVADDDILGWFVPETTVVVSSALDGDAVVAGVEDTVLDEYILACLRVASVSVRSFVPNSYAVYRDVLAEQRVHHPERRVDHLYILDEDALRAYEVDELRAETLSHTELTLIKRHAVFCHFLQSGAGAHLLVFLGYALLVSEVRVAVPLPPCIIVAASVDGTFTGNGDVGNLVGVDAWRVVPACQSFPCGANQRIEFWLKGKLQYGTFFEIQFYEALHLNGSCAPGTLRYDYGTATFLRNEGDEFVDCLLVLCSRSVLLGSIGRNYILLGCLLDVRQLYALFNALIFSIVPSIICPSAGRDEEQSNE